MQLTYENYNLIRDRAESTNDYKGINDLMWSTFVNSDYSDMVRIILDFECTRLRRKYYSKYNMRGNNPPLLGSVFDDIQEMILTLYSVFEIEDSSLIDFFSIGFLDILFCNGEMFVDIDNLEAELDEQEYHSNFNPDMYSLYEIYTDNEIAVFIHDYLKYLYNTTPLQGRDELIIFDTESYMINDSKEYFMYLKGDVITYVYNF